MARYSLAWSAGPFVAHPVATRLLPVLRAVPWERVLVWLVFPLTLALAITRQSLWIDEGFTVYFASHGDLQSFFRALIGSRGAPGDPQFILYLFHMWGWIKLFGAGELSVRAANIPFAAVFIYTMSWASRRLFWNDNLWALFCLSPFFWFYLNEARPYAAVLAFSSVATVALLAYLVDPVRHGKHAPWVCLIALFLGSGMHILTFFLFPVLLVLLVSTLARDRGMRSVFFHHWSRPILCCLPAFLALGTFYLLVSGNGVNKNEGQPSLANVAFALYEFNGFAGLGPPRYEIREAMSPAVFLPYWPWLLLGGAVVLAVVVSAFRSAQGTIARNLFVSVMCGFVVAFVVSRLEHFQILGRHLAVLFPGLFMIVMLAPRTSTFQPKLSRPALASFAALAVIWAVSDLRLIFLSKYQKDSYREACSIALAKSRQEGALIIWAADPFTAKYYGLDVAATNSPPNLATDTQAGIPALAYRALQARVWSFDRAAAHIATSTMPTVLVLTRPYSFDPQGTWSTLIREVPPTEVARLNALSIYEWKPQKSPGCSDCMNPASPLRELIVENAWNSHFPEHGAPPSSTVAARFTNP